MPKSANRRADNVLAMPSIAAASVAGLMSDVTEIDIARRAFELYCERGCEHGHDLGDWLEAERELRRESGSSAA